MTENEIAMRARRLLGRRDPSARSGAIESAEGRVGPPDEKDAAAISGTLQRVTSPDARRSPPLAVETAGLAGSAPEMDFLAKMMVERARDLMMRLENGASQGSFAAEDVVALESVVRVRGRPALAVEGERIEALDDRKHPGSGFWRTQFNRYEEDLASIASGAGAVTVQDTITGAPPWIQGTAWLISEGLTITNRHVIFPPLGGMRLARRDPTNRTRATVKADLNVIIDFANERGRPRTKQFKVMDVPYVSEDGDPVDVAVLKIAGNGLNIRKESVLTLATSASKLRQLYVIGHPGRMTNASKEVLAVFGVPDGKKRVSLGETMTGEPPRKGELNHDASTIGGFSGGCVVYFGTSLVAALHYYGDPLNGNRAITAATLRAHAVGAFVP